VLGLVALEGFFVTGAGVLAGVGLSVVAAAVAAPWVQAHLGIALGGPASGLQAWPWLIAVLGAGLLASLVPAWRATRLALADGLTPRI